MSNPNPEFQAYGYDRLQWQEELSAGELRNANDYLEHYGNRSLKSITGYYTDNFQHESAVPAVRVVQHDCPRCDGSGTDPKDGGDCELCESYGNESQYYAAVRDPNNDGAAVVDVGNVYTDSAEAAKAAHHLAERYAEDSREEDAKFQAEQQIESAAEEIANVRKEHSRYVGAILQYRDGSYDNATCARLRAEMRSQVHKAAKRVRALRENFWVSVE